MPSAEYLKVLPVALIAPVTPLYPETSTFAAFKEPFAPATDKPIPTVPEPIDCHAASASASVFAVAALYAPLPTSTAPIAAPAATRNGAAAPPVATVKAAAPAATANVVKVLFILNLPVSSQTIPLKKLPTPLAKFANFCVPEIFPSSLPSATT